MLNVGGVYFMTSRTTLAKSTPPNSPLHRISTNSTNVQWDRDEKGAYLIDRDPDFFKSVLNYLRHGKLVLGRDMSEEGIILEAEYFQLPELIKVAKQRLALRQRYLSSLMAAHQMHLDGGSGALYPFSSPSSSSISSTMSDHCESWALKSAGIKQEFGNQNQLAYQQQQQQQQHQTRLASIMQGNSVSSLLKQPEYLSNYVNSILEEGFVS